MKKVVVAKSAGFCWGVRRAFDKVVDTVKNKAADEKVYTYGPLIHNPQAVETLEKMGVSVLDEMPKDIKGTVFIRTHGLCPEERESLRRSGSKICDSTCPDVGIIQGIVRKHVRRGYHAIIVGNLEHPEVRALLGYAENKGVAVSTKEEIETKLPTEWKNVCVVAQSTQKEEKFEELVQVIKKKYPQAVIFNTICSSTTERQEEVRMLSREVDAVVVVGGFNSANTTKLAQISREMGTPTFHIETEKELNHNDFEGFDTIGVTAGSSTPSWLIEKVVERLSQF